MNTTQSTTVVTAIAPSCRPRLLTGQPGREDLAAYRGLGAIAVTTVVDCVVFTAGLPRC
ncbi:hypothetical protein MAHJHV28_45480 [Mycobacterium avium subsp. hominissuis]